MTATLTGLFLAATDNVQQHIGYGHLGCCHLLAIEKIADVEAKRTPIPMGGSFQCDSDAKTLDPIEAQRLNSLDKPCGALSFRQCQDSRFQEIAAAATYWNDPLHPEDGTLGVGELAGNTSKQSWVSVDKLKTYTVSIQLDDPNKADSTATGGVITREVCKPTVPPLPMSAVVSCRNLWSEFPMQKSEVEKASQAVAQGKEEWRMSPAGAASLEALKEAAGAWGIALSNDLQTPECDKPMVVDNDQFDWCHWTSRDGMQSLNIQISRFGYLRGGRSWDSVPWILTRGNAVVCSVEQ